MIPVEGVVKLFESKARIKILMVLWIIAVVFLVVNVPLRWLPFTAFSVWGLVEIGFNLKDRNQGKELKAAVDSSYTLKPGKIFEGLSAEALVIVRFWTLPGNRFKPQKLNYMNDEVQALERARVIEEDDKTFDDLEDEWTDYKITDWAAIFLGKNLHALNKK